MDRKRVSNLALHSSECKFPRLATAPGRGCASSNRPCARALPARPAWCSHALGHAQPAGAE
eukprot:5314937-Alexandrium_andersonii.AAC.1